MLEETDKPTPSGVGIYLRGLGHKSQGTPEQAAKKAADHGVSFVALMAIWQTAKRTLWSNGRDPALLVRYAEAFRTAGIDVGLWGYPAAGKVDEYLDRLTAVTEACGRGVISWWLHDPELEFKWSPTTGPRAFVEAQAVRLREGAAGSGLRQGVTSFAAIDGHPTLPWRELGGFGFGSPQLYTVGPAEVDHGIARWRKAGWESIVPSVPLYGRNSGAKLHDYLSCFVDGDEEIDGLIFWSWRQGTADEWRVIERWSRWLARGMCLVSAVD